MILIFDERQTRSIGGSGEAFAVISIQASAPTPPTGGGQCIATGIHGSTNWEIGWGVN
jgi:hypothetical protein